MGVVRRLLRPEDPRLVPPRGLQPADAEDVTQDVLLRLSRALKMFTYDPSRTFRGWLRAVTLHALNDFAAERVVSRESRVVTPECWRSWGPCGPETNSWLDWRSNSTARWWPRPAPRSDPRSSRKPGRLSG